MSSTASCPAPGSATTACTLLLADVVDSTALADRLDAAALAAWWQAHDAAARALLRTWHGREIDKSDGFLLLFETVDDALAYAADYHRTLAGLVPAQRARVGVHRAEVVRIDGQSYRAKEAQEREAQRLAARSAKATPARSRKAAT